MGGAVSTDNIKNDITHDRLFNLVNEVASNYIFSSSFYDLREASSAEYCSKLTILTKDIIEKSLKQRNISALHSKLYPNSNSNKEPVFFINKSTLDRVNKDTNSKQTLCKQIAKFYIKIYHVFIAIINVIQPSWHSNTSSSNQDILPYKKFYDKARKDISIRDNYTRKDKGFCVTQLLTLLGQDNLANIFTMESDKEFNVNINKLCKKYRDRNRSSSKMDTIQESIPGFNELKRLYNDIYDPNKGDFTSMSTTMKAKYKQDVIDFYTTFTNNTTQDAIRNNIQDFSDIKVSDLTNAICSEKFKDRYDNSDKSVLINTIDPSFKLFAKHLKKMYLDSEKYKKELMEIIKQLFVKYRNNDSSDSRFSYLINPQLTYPDLEKFSQEAQKIIIQLYLSCQQNFKKGITLYKDLIGAQVLETTEKSAEQIEENIKLVKDNILSSYNKTKADKQKTPDIKPRSEPKPEEKQEKEKEKTEEQEEQEKQEKEETEEKEKTEETEEKTEETEEKTEQEEK